MNDPYRTVGLRGNPFTAEPQPGVAPNLWVERGEVRPLAQANALVQLFGDKGAGKTSLMLHWRSVLPGPYYYVPIDRNRWRLPPLAPLVYWDEVDRLPWPLLLISLLRARRIRATVVAGTHRSVARTAAVCGITVRTITFAPLSAALLQHWAAQRIAAAQHTDTQVSLALDTTTATYIAQRAGTSWREAANLLHIWAAEQARASTQCVE